MAVMVPCIGGACGRQPVQLCARCFCVKYVRDLAPELSWKCFQACPGHNQVRRDRHAGIPELARALAKQCAHITRGALEPLLIFEFPVRTRNCLPCQHWQPGARCRHTEFEGQGAHCAASSCRLDLQGGRAILMCCSAYELAQHVFGMLGRVPVQAFVAHEDDAALRCAGPERAAACVILFPSRNQRPYLLWYAWERTVQRVCPWLCREATAGHRCVLQMRLRTMHAGADAARRAPQQRRGPAFAQHIKPMHAWAALFRVAAELQAHCGGHGGPWDVADAVR